jgi:hypothetical protein
MLIYKIFTKGASPCLVIPKVRGVENQAVDIFIDATQQGVRLYYSFTPASSIKKHIKENIWLQHEHGVISEFFADRLLGGVTAIRVVNNSDVPVIVKINPITNLSRKHG